jgi:hypothetical protein
MTRAERERHGIPKINGDVFEGRLTIYRRLLSQSPEPTRWDWILSWLKRASSEELQEVEAIEP